MVDKVLNAGACCNIAEKHTQLQLDKLLIHSQHVQWCMLPCFNTLCCNSFLQTGSGCSHKTCSKCLICTSLALTAIVSSQRYQHSQTACVSYTSSASLKVQADCTIQQPGSLCCQAKVSCMVCDAARMQHAFPWQHRLYLAVLCMFVYYLLRADRQSPIYAIHLKRKTAPTCVGFTAIKQV